MGIEQFNFNKRFTKARKLEFAKLLIAMQEDELDMKMSSRGWAYLLENKRLINKDQFDRVQDAINSLRKDGILPVDFVAEDMARGFSCIHRPSRGDVEDMLRSNISDVTDGAGYFKPHYWETVDIKKFEEKMERMDRERDEEYDKLLDTVTIDVESIMGDDGHVTVREFINEAANN